MRITLLNFLVAACIGALLRYAFVSEVSWLNFRYFLHAHSHVAMLGWVYQALFILLIYSFLTKVQRESPIYRWLFWSSQFSVLGMLCTFPYMGYASWSILFSTLHILVSYVFVFRFFRDLATSAGSWSRRLVKTAMLFMVISTLALWAMAPIILLDLKGSALYYASVQFYLHFQFNGWFTFAALALFFRVLEQQQIALPEKLMRNFYGFLVLACFLTYALAVAWSTPLKIIFWTNSLGVASQLIAAIMLIGILRRTLPGLQHHFPRWAQLLLQISLACFLLKILMQAVIIVPYIATIGYTIHNYVIGFIHLILLGVITTFLLAYAHYKSLLKLDTFPAQVGLALFLAGFFLTELILFSQGTLLWAGLGFLPFYYEGLFSISLLLPLGVLLLSVAQWIPYQKGTI